MHFLCIRIRRWSGIRAQRNEYPIPSQLSIRESQGTVTNVIVTNDFPTPNRLRIRCWLGTRIIKDEYSSFSQLDIRAWLHIHKIEYPIPSSQLISK